MAKSLQCFQKCSSFAAEYLTINSVVTMKRMMIVCWTLILGMGTNLYAQTTTTHQLSLPSFQVKSLEAQKPGWYQVLFQNNQSTRAKVSVYDQAGQVMDIQYSKNTAVFAKSYDLTRLPLGSYTFEVSTADTVLTASVEYTGKSGLYAAKAAIRESKEPGKYTLVMDNPYVSPLYVRIYENRDGALLYSDALEQKGVYRQVFNLQDVYASTVTFVVSDEEGNVLTEEVKLK